MSSRRWQEMYKKKVVPAKKALSYIKNGQTIYIGSGGAEPVALTEALAEMADEFSDIRIIHLIAQRDQRLARPELRRSFRYSTFYIGRGVEEAVATGSADHVPMNLSELPGAIRQGTVLVDVALIQVTVPDRKGRCSLGISVGATKAAVESAKLVIAQVNENMVHTMGDSQISVSDIDFLVEAEDFPSRSEVIRTAVRDLVNNRLELVTGNLERKMVVMERMSQLEEMKRRYLSK